MPTRRSFLTNLGVLALLGGGAWWARERFLWPPPKPQFAAAEPSWLPFSSRRHSLITVTVGVGSQMVNALIDSGAQYSTIDRTLADELQLESGFSTPMVAMGVGGSVQMAKNVQLDLDLGGARFPRLRTAALDLGVLSQAMGQDTRLIIGFDVLSSVIVEIDFVRRRLRLSPREGFVFPPGGSAAPVRRDGRSLLAQVVLEGTPIELFLDTGATGVVGLSEASAQEVGLTGRAARQSRSVVHGVVALTRLVEIERVVFAGETFRDVDAHIIQLPNVPGFPKGLLGIEALRRFRVVMDAGGGRLQLYPPRKVST